jgi:mRNA interferase MazF
MVKIEPTIDNGLIKNSFADTFQVRSVSDKRFIRKIGYLDANTMEEIQLGLSKVLSINLDY